MFYKMATTTLKITALAVLFYFPPPAYADPNRHVIPKNFSILATTSLMEVMPELLRRYAAEASSTATVTLASPEELLFAIEIGEPADVVITESKDNIRDLQQRGNLDIRTIIPLMRNRLAYVAARNHMLGRNHDSAKPLAVLMAELQESEVVLGDPDTLPVGRAAKQSLEKIGYWQDMEPLLVRTGSARAALYLIAKGRRTGIVYYSDAVHNDEIKILAEFPTESHDPIIYQAAVVAGDHMEDGRKFLKFLQSAEARQIFTEHGFSVENQ